MNISKYSSVTDLDLSRCLSNLNAQYNDNNKDENRLTIRNRKAFIHIWNTLLQDGTVDKRGNVYIQKSVTELATDYKYSRNFMHYTIKKLRKIKAINYVKAPRIFSPIIVNGEKRFLTNEANKIYISKEFIHELEKLTDND